MHASKAGALINLKKELQTVIEPYASLTNDFPSHSVGYGPSVAEHTEREAVPRK